MATRAAGGRRPAPPPPSPVTTPGTLDRLHPSRQGVALAMSSVGTPDGRPDPTRIVVESPGRFSVMPVGWAPPARRRRRR